MRIEQIGQHNWSRGVLKLDPYLAGAKQHSTTTGSPFSDREKGDA